MDALEVFEKNEVPYKSQKDGLMYACGHDGHTAMLLGSCPCFKRNTKQYKGTVILFFQPAEETASGAKEVLEKYDLLGDVDSVFAIHLWQELKLEKFHLSQGARMAAADAFFIKVKGKSGHGSMPHGNN